MQALGDQAHSYTVYLNQKAMSAEGKIADDSEYFPFHLYNNKVAEVTVALFTTNKVVLFSTKS